MTVFDPELREVVDEVAALDAGYRNEQNWIGHTENCNREKKIVCRGETMIQVLICHPSCLSFFITDARA